MDNETAQRQAEALRMLHEVTRAVNAEVKMEALFDIVIDSALKLTRAERGFLVLKRASGAMDPVVAREISQATIEHPAFKFSKGIIREAVSTAQAVVLPDAQEDRVYSRHQSVMINQPFSVACVPLKRRDNVLGVIYLDSRIRRKLFTPDLMMVLEMFADHAASAIHNARMASKIRRLEKAQE